MVGEQREVGEERSRKEPKKKPRTTLHFSAVERAPPSRLARHAASRCVGLHTLLCSRLSSLDFAVWLLSQRVPNGPMRFNKLKLKPEKLMEFFLQAFPLVVAALRASLCGACVPRALSLALSLFLSFRADISYWGLWQRMQRCVYVIFCRKTFQKLFKSASFVLCSLIYNE